MTVKLFGHVVVKLVAVGPGPAAVGGGAAFLLLCQGLLHLLDFRLEFSYLFVL